MTEKEYEIARSSEAIPNKRLNDLEKKVKELEEENEKLKKRLIELAEIR